MKLSLAIAALALAIPTASYAQDSTAVSKESIPIRSRLGLPTFPHLPINPKDLMIGLFQRGLEFHSFNQQI